MHFIFIYFDFMFKYPPKYGVVPNNTNYLSLNQV